MARVHVNGISISYRGAGTGFPFVFIHGLSDSSALWTPLTPLLSTHYRTIAVDLRGHGGSAKPNAPYSVQLFSEDLLCFLQKLGIQNAHLMGLSLGAAVAEELALDHPEKVRSLVLLSPFSNIDSESRHSLEMLRESVVKGGLPAFFDAAIRLVVTPDFIAANADAIAEAKKQCININSNAGVIHAIDACLKFDERDRISQISQPTLIVSGRQDALTPIHLAEQIHRSIKGSKWKIIEGVGHNLLVPGKIPELAETILEFMQHQ
jgi:3-oxoadipate enol-lactonase